MRIPLTALLLAPAVVFAGSSTFDGTWKGRVDSVKVTGKPDVFAVADGMFTCATCDPPIKIKADGSEQKVTGHDYYDTLVMKVVDAKTVERTAKLAGKVTGVYTASVSADGSTLNGKYTDYTGAKPATFAFTEKRVAAGPSGSHAVSGSWAPDKTTDANDAGTIVTYKMTADSFSMSANGQSYDAKFDGKEYPIMGDPGHTTVTLKKLSANAVQETDHRQGKVTDVIHLATAADGKSISLTDKDLIHSQTTTITLDKQP
ncbi:MAG TPA: hypothetical protein VLV25_14100 [Steroidobacteraceae bacterium]|nr:hypothetical protein [Steroidobacteraceae bacterium]